MDSTFKFKLVLFGNPAVGKTSIVERYINDKFEADYISTLGYNVYEKILNIKNSQVSFLIYDIGGQEQFRNLRKQYANGARAAVLVYDVTNRESFDNIKNWYKDLMEFTNNAYFILIGNKVDLEGDRQVKREDGEKLANELLALEFFETSAKYNIDVDKAFQKFAEKIVENI